MVVNVFKRVFIGALWFSVYLWEPTTQCQFKGCLDGTMVGFTAIKTKTGVDQWTTEVNFDRYGDINGAWSIKVHQNNFDCPGIIQFTATLSVPPMRSIKGYDFIPGVGYYKTHPPGKNWEEARRICVREGGHLAIVNSEIESTILQLMFGRTSSRQPYALIGFHDHYVAREYLTLYDQPIVTTGFTRWGDGQPDNSGDEHCGSISRFDGSLNDISCGSTAWPFICEIEL